MSQAELITKIEPDNSGNPIPHERQKSYSYKNLVCIHKDKLSSYVPTH